MNKNTYLLDGTRYRVVSRTARTMNLRVCADPSTLAGLRERAGVKQYEMCERTGLTSSELSKYERAEQYGRRVPSWLRIKYEQLRSAEQTTLERKVVKIAK